MGRVERGIICDFDAVTRTASVELVETGHIVLASVPVAWHIDWVQVEVPVHCVVMISNDLKTSTCVVLALYQGVAPAVTLEFP